MTKIAQCACEVCHKIIPRTEAVETYITEKSGHSGFSASSKVSDITSFNLQNFRINSGRNYYRKKKIWVCNSCWAGYNKFMEDRNIPYLVLCFPSDVCACYRQGTCGRPIAVGPVDRAPGVWFGYQQ